MCEVKEFTTSGLERRLNPAHNRTLTLSDKEMYGAITGQVGPARAQLGLERHGARTLPGRCARIGMRLLALATGLWHNWEIGEPGRHFTAYAH